MYHFIFRRLLYTTLVYIRSDYSALIAQEGNMKTFICSRVVIFNSPYRLWV